MPLGTFDNFISELEDLNQTDADEKEKFMRARELIIKNLEGKNTSENLEREPPKKSEQPEPEPEGDDIPAFGL